MKRLFDILKAEFISFKGEIKSYSLNYLFYNISIIVIFIGIFYAVGAESSKDSLIMLYGLVSWQLCNSALTYISGVIEDEAMMGTLEQIFMTRTKGIKIFSTKILLNIIFNVLKAMIIFIICAYVFGIIKDITYLGVKNIYVILAIIISVYTFGMIGLFFGGMSLYFKKVQSFLYMFSYVLLYFSDITSSIEDMPFFLNLFSKIIPLTMLQSIIRGIVLGSLKYEDALLFVSMCILYILAGYYFFGRLLQVAKKKGKLGQY